jgi:hypothetical protein
MNFALTTLSPDELQAQFRLLRVKDKEEHLGFPWLPRKTYNYYLGDKAIGWGCVRIDPARWHLVWERFYPHEQGQTQARHGIGTLAHVATLLELVAQPDVTSSYNVLGDFATPSRQIQYGKMGIVPYRATPLPEYLRKSIEYANGRKGFNFSMPVLR